MEVPIGAVDRAGRRAAMIGPFKGTRGRAFGFPSPPAPSGPARTLSRFAALRVAAWFAGAALAASVTSNFARGVAALGRADARAYATDGSLYGCELEERDAPAPPPGGERRG